MRSERKEDFAPIYELVKKAFETAKVADGTEQEFVDELRLRKGYIPELALVAEKEGVIVGHVMLTETGFTAKDGKPRKVLLLAPLSVKLECRSQGIGGELIREAAERASEMGYAAVFLAGDPDYYSRYGFMPAARFGIATSTGIPEKNALVRELVPGALKDMEGTVDIM